MTNPVQEFKCFINRQSDSTYRKSTCIDHYRDTWNRWGDVHNSIYSD